MKIRAAVLLLLCLPMAAMAAFGPGKIMFSAGGASLYPPQLVTDQNLMASSLPAGITYSRTGTATDIISGVVTRFSANAPRISTANGLLIEPGRTNLVKMNSSAATAGTLTSGETDPEGTSLAYLYTATATTTGQQWSTGASTIAYANGTTYTTSAFVKAGTFDRVQMFISSSVVATGNAYANYYLNGSGSVSAAGASITASGIQSLGTGWYRIWMTFTATGASTNTLAFCKIITGSETRAPSVAGSSQTMYFYGAQVEVGATLTSYIPTTTASATRGADIAYETMPFSFKAATIYAAGTVPYFSSAQSTARLISAASSTSNTAYINRPLSGSDHINGQVTTGGVSQANIDSGQAPAQGATVKAAMGMAIDDVGISGNGATAVDDTSTPNGLPTISAIYIGQDSASGNQWGGYVTAYKVWNYRQTDSYLESLTP